MVYVKLRKLNIQCENKYVTGKGFVSENPWNKAIRPQQYGEVNCCKPKLS